MFLLNRKNRIAEYCQRTSCRTEKKEVLLKICEKICLRRNRQTWQSYQICQRKILSLSDKNSLSRLNLKPQFIIRGWSEAGGFYTKITQNCQISEPNSADLCNMIFNGIYSLCLIIICSHFVSIKSRIIRVFSKFSTNPVILPYKYLYLILLITKKPGHI